MREISDCTIVFFIILINIFYPSSAGTTSVEIHKEQLWPRGKQLFIPNAKNPNHTIAALLERNPFPIPDPDAEITYYLYPKHDAGKAIQIDLKDLGEHRRHIDPQGIWFFGIHGFNGDYTAGPIFRSTAKAIHAARSSNIIQVDWKRLAAAPWYLTAKDNTKHVGTHVAATITYLVLNGLAQPERIHLVGFSLGAHAAGYAGKVLSEKHRLRQHRITGLDPANPGYDDSKDNRLDSSDGRQVEVFHTCGGSLGILQTSGHVDFYVNGGKPTQPDCDWTESLTLHSCSHQFALKVFNHQIREKYIAHKCRDIKSATTKTCASGISCNVGFLLPSCPNGIYYLGVL